MLSMGILAVIVLCAGGIVWGRRRRWQAYTTPVSPGTIPRETLALHAFAQGNSCLAEGKFAEAIAAFERTIVSQNSAFDKHAMGETGAMNEVAVRGLELFRGKARCILCHNGPNLTDNKFHNLGVPQVGPLKEDLGRYMVTRAQRDKGAFKTPTLRSAVETAPYMHDGVFKTLEEVIDFFDAGGGSNPNLSPLMKPLGLSSEEKADLLEFLKALTGAPIKVNMPKLPK